MEDVSKSTVLILLFLVMVLTALSTLAVLQELQTLPTALPPPPGAPPDHSAKVGINIMESPLVGRIVLVINPQEAT